MSINKKEEKKQNEKKKLLYLSILTIILVIVLVIGGYFLYQYNQEEQEKTILPYTELIKDINDETVEKVEMTKGSTTIKVKLANEEEEKTTLVPNIQAFTEYVQNKVEQGSSIEVIQKEQNIFVRISDGIFTILPTALMAILIIMIY